MGVLTYSRAFFEAFEGSVFYHQARQFLITRLDLPSSTATCRPVRVGYSTTAKNDTIITVLKQMAGHGSLLAYGTVSVVRKVSGFIKRDIVTRELLEEGDFSLPPLEMTTQVFASPVDNRPAGLSRPEVRGLRASNSRSTTRLCAMAANLAAENATTIHASCATVTG